MQLLVIIISAVAVLPLLLVCHFVADYGRRHGIVHTGYTDVDEDKADEHQNS